MLTVVDDVLSLSEQLHTRAHALVVALVVTLVQAQEAFLQEADDELLFVWLEVLFPLELLLEPP